MPAVSLQWTMPHCLRKPNKKFGYRLTQTITRVPITIGTPIIATTNGSDAANPKDIKRHSTLQRQVAPKLVCTLIGVEGNKQQT